VRDHSPGRPGVELVRYEAWEEQAERVLTDVAAEARRRHPTLGRVVLLHRTGALGVGEVSVVVATSAPHRAEAFDAGRFCIDTIKVTLPVWKLERWEGGEEFGLDAHPARPA
jgi:molybdopterin synthase catalytic subunit